ncbi:NAD(P)/FAD-dependent oxidoreductase [Phaeovulum sp.]|uniref:NAD(P)/FAD-dependent oxidoreductase n=1 Tax=Phaeovulum sp. TaxID=2934796 RepID=UPI0039E588AC
MSGIIIIGAGQAAASLAVKLRGQGYEAPITVMGDEPVTPYQRPPLSKAYLLGEMPVDRLTLRADGFWADQDITLRLGAPVTSINRAAKTVIQGGETAGYEQLALTTGATPRYLPAAMGGHLFGVFTVRTLADVDAMAPHFSNGARLVVIGGGYIGLEAAAVASKLGLKVTLIESAARILGRVACAETANAVRTMHADHGVTILEGAAISRITGDTHATGVDLADGRHLPADFIITGIGITPNTDLAKAADLVIDNGIAVDEHGRTADPAIWAAGDCASFPHQSGRLRLESVGNAIDMAECVAENMLGANRVYQPKPWFWSDQFDTKLQIAGLGTGYDRIVARDSEGQSFWYFKGPTLLAIDALNAPRAYMIGKRLIEAGRSPDPETLPMVADLKALL